MSTDGDVDRLKCEKNKWNSSEFVSKPDSRVGRLGEKNLSTESVTAK